MIPVASQPEPPDFGEKVRIPGQAFLATNPSFATRQDWKGKEYWRGCLDDLAAAYRQICAYSAHWISTCEGFRSVDHFVPISVEPSEAYEWTNFRFVSGRMNARKGSYQDVLDPFRIKSETFELDFSTLEVLPGKKLSKRLQAEAEATIARLKLNDEICIEGRTKWLRPYCEGQVTLEFLHRRAPFTAYEIERQNVSLQRLRKILRVPQAS